MLKFKQLLYQKLLGISPSVTKFENRHFFLGNHPTQIHLETIGAIFIEGYRQALVSNSFDDLIPKLNSIEPDFQGFAFEGAAMALALLDHLVPWSSNRCRDFLCTYGSDHKYMIHVGIGWAVARLHIDLNRFLVTTDPLLGWLVVDGYGFHEGYFYGDRYLLGDIYPKKLNSHQKKVFDQGLGRSLWFRECADPERISNTIERCEVQRHGDLWRGIGLACAYAGGVDRSALNKLLQIAKTYRSQLAQGAAFAAKARQRAGNLTPHTELACNIFCNLSSERVAEIVDLALENLSPCESEPLYESWQCRIQCLLVLKEVSI
jgi:enediyne biosynthesis protein E3